MGNMGYIRFENTLRDLEDCEEHIYDTGDLNETEVTARKKLIELCVEIALEHGSEVDRHLDEQD